jgi:DNA-binding MarR family transcriptional regulator
MPRLTAPEPDRQVTPGFDRGANLLGALSLALSDRISAAISVAAAQSQRPGSETAAEALSALHHFLDGPSIDRLRTVLGLTSSGTVRLVDRLEQAGYVERRPGADGRTTTVGLTAAGERVATAVSQAREAVLVETLAALSAPQRAALESLTGSLLVGLIREPGSTRWSCRLCNTGVCGVTTLECPVSRAAYERFAKRPPADE